jgi:hypothetical protein
MTQIKTPLPEKFSNQKATDDDSQLIYEVMRAVDLHTDFLTELAAVVEGKQDTDWTRAERKYCTPPTPTLKERLMEEIKNRAGLVYREEIYIRQDMVEAIINRVIPDNV